MNRAIAQTEPDYDEVSVYLNVQHIDNTEITALIRNEKAYLPVSEIFSFLKINNNPSHTRDTLSGFFIDQKVLYLIDKSTNKIRIKDKTFELKPTDLIKTPAGLYLQSDLFGQVFGLTCLFSFRSLSVTLTTELELPVMRELRLNQAHNNFNQLKGEAKIDTVIGRTYPAFHFGMADWAVVNSYETNAASNTRVSLGVGGLIAGGETNVLLNYNSSAPLLDRDQFYSWRLANNDNKAVRQIVAGKIFGQSTASIYAPIIGGLVTNAPTTYRRTYGSYTIANVTTPNWMVELYVNNVLVSFVRADASGFYKFEVPLVYGNSQIKLRFYGPSGEERFTEQNISVPFNFLPKHEFEYTAIGGIVEDIGHSRYSRFSANYGINNMITVGGGNEYLSSVTSGVNMPFVNTSVRPLNSLLLSGDYIYGVRTRALATYRFTSGLQIELNDTWYKHGQTAINNTYSEERRAVISSPLQGKNFSAYSRLTLDQIILPVTKYTTTEWLLSGGIGRINATATTYALFIEKTAPYFYSNFAASTTIFNNYLITEQAQYEYRGSRFISLKEQIERRFLTNGYVYLSYENNVYSRLNTFEIGLRFDFNFAQTGSSVRANSFSTRYLQYANGSFIVDAKSRYTGLSNHNNVGRGGITISPFLDLNNNGVKDVGEPKAPGLKIRINGGRILQDTKDTTIRITDLEPYINYTVEMDPLSFDNIAWQMKKHNFSIAVDPNKIKLVSVPIFVASDVSGRVFETTTDGLQGVGRLIVCFYKDNSDKVFARTTTEDDGFFTYLGLSPGSYSARVDADQLKNLHLTETPESIKFSVKRSVDGVTIEGLELILRDISKTLVVKEKMPSQSIPEVNIKTDSLNNKLGDTKTSSIVTNYNGNLYSGKTDTILPDRTAEKLSGRKVQTLKSPAKADNINENLFLLPNISKADSLSLLKKTQYNLTHPFEYDYTVQVAHFKEKNAVLVLENLCKKYGYNVIIRQTTHRYYNVRITGLPNSDAAKRIINIIKRKGFKDAYMLANRRSSL